MEKNDKKLCILLFISALIPRILSIDREHEHIDESVYTGYGFQYIEQIIELNIDKTYWMETYHNFEHPPLAKLLFGMAIYFSKNIIDPLVAARLVVVILGSLTVIVLFFFTKELFNRKIYKIYKWINCRICVLGRIYLFILKICYFIQLKF